MSWTRVFVLSLLAALLILTCEYFVQMGGKTERASRVFMPESDASNFFKRRNRRSYYDYAEGQAEQRVQYTANEHRRESGEDRRGQRERFAEEDQDEQNERTRETHEQYREYHYDGLYPRYRWYF
ncbi:putative cartilage matrix-associated protein [Collichthys lucidus]|uniref:Unique cartilage matrix-associated protein n=1 Tax=Collichthys lucidus TaxID=240159 RepID=A0A4U5VR73_COLLU|nr:putative cartilage matrix-associated protein [Collichthys lucidus]